MARIRTIKPSFFTDDHLADLPLAARLLFIGLWCVSDREGRVEDRPKKLKAELLPFDKANVEALLGQLADAGFIVRYVYENDPYIQVVNFTKHQIPHIKERASTIPAPGEHRAKPVLAASARVGEGKGREGEGKGKEGAAAAREASATNTLYEELIGELNSHTAGLIEAAVGDYGEPCVLHSLQETAVNGARSWKYTETIMARHKREGCVDAPRANHAAPERIEWLGRRYHEGKDRVSTAPCTCDFDVRPPKQDPRCLRHGDMAAEPVVAKKGAKV